MCCASTSSRSRSASCSIISWTRSRRAPRSRPASGSRSSRTRTNRRDQRLTYALHGGLTAQQVMELTGIDAPALVGEVIAAYRKTNKHVHGRESNIVRDLDEQDDIVDGIIDALGDFLQTYREFRERIVDGIARSLQYKAIEAFTIETIEKLDVMATHHIVDWVGIDGRAVVAIGAKLVEYEVVGSAGVTLLYGSSSDRNRGEGAEMEEQFPITLRFAVPIEDPHDLDQAEVTSDIDTSDWYE